MAKGFFRERKHYSLKTIAENLYDNNIDLEETKRLVGILKKYGVVKSVKKTKPEFEDLSNEDIVLSDVVDNSGDIEYVFDYVGVVLLEGNVFKCYPKYIKSIDEPIDELKQVLKVIKKYNASEQLVHLFNGEDDNKIFNRLAVALHLLEEYYTYGLYTNQYEIIETNGEGEILWDKTINETFAIIQNNKPYYVELQTQNTVDNDYDYFRRLHEYILTDCSKELEKTGLLDLFDLTGAELTDASMEQFGDSDYILYRLQKEIQTQYITRKQNLLKTLYTYVANDKTDKDDISYSLYGTNSFNLVWEKVCSDNFGSVLDKRIGDLPLCNSEHYNKNDTLRSIIDKPHWYGNNPKVDDGNVETLKPDLICVYPFDTEKTEYCFGIYDAKYYCINFSNGKITGQPGVGDITKQYLYQLAYDDFISKEGYKYVQNMFFCPQEVADIDYGYAEMNMLHHIGDKILENIAVVKLCATEMYDIYLSNRKIESEKLKEYIPSIAVKKITNDNFSNRMIMYLRKITQASRLAQEKLEMKSDRGNLIYPKQIKRELGAKIIYDVICPIATSVYYGFDPYEKENYENMVAEDNGASFAKCNQIADVAIEIEKDIKCMSENDLLNQNVIKEMIEKNINSKQDIKAITEGNCFNKLLDKIMELISDVYI